MNKTFLILLPSKAIYIEARFIPLLKSEVSKIFYSSKANDCNVQGVGTFFDTCLNLGQLFHELFPRNSKKLYGDFAESSKHLRLRL
jgi:hypothetical protein